MHTPKKFDENTPKNARQTKRVIRLDDLDVDEEVVMGGSNKLFFGEQSEPSQNFNGGFATENNEPPSGGMGQ